MPSPPPSPSFPPSLQCWIFGSTMELRPLGTTFMTQPRLLVRIYFLTSLLYSFSFPPFFLLSLFPSYFSFSSSFLPSLPLFPVSLPPYLPPSLRGDTGGCVEDGVAGRGGHVWAHGAGGAARGCGEGDRSLLLPGGRVSPEHPLLPVQD